MLLRIAARAGNAKEAMQAAGAEQEETTEQRRTCFHLKSPPNIEIEDYLLRIRKHIDVSDACFVLSLIYIDRVTSQNPETMVSSLTCHRLALISIMSAFRFHDDENADIHYNNAFFAKVGGVKVHELNILEIQFLQLLDWRLYVSQEEYQRYHARVRHMGSNCDWDHDPQESSKNDSIRIVE